MTAIPISGTDFISLYESGTIVRVDIVESVGSSFFVFCVIRVDTVKSQVVYQVS